MIEMCLLTSKYFAEDISVICSVVMSKKHSFYSRFNVHFVLEINAVEPDFSSVLIFSIVRVFSVQKRSGPYREKLDSKQSILIG
jgi:hypothetical protein